MEMSQEAQMFIEAMTSNEDKYASTAPSFTSTSEPTDAASDKKSTSSSQKPMHNPIRLDDDLLPGVRFVVNRFTLYETKTRFYLFGTNHQQKRYRVLKIDRTSPKELVVIEEDALYTRKEAEQLLKMIIDGNRNSGGCNEVPMQIHGIIGFVKFTQGWYMLFITRRSQVALLGGHYIYHIDETKLVPIGLPVKYDKNSDEARYIAIFQNVDMTKNFYFSYTYDITNTLQVNMTRAPYTEDMSDEDKKSNADNGYNLMFVWNHHLLKAGFESISSQSSWILPMIYGFVDQAKISVLGRNVFVTLIARRSRYFAGARFLKRGANDKGYVANDVETEQIVCEMATTSFHLGDKLFDNPRYTSYVQHRGSIPLFWSQDTTNMSPKPKIELNLVDPFFSSAALHFDNLFQRYGAPCIVLNLIKQKEKTKRESILGKEFAEAIKYLNQFLPDDKKIRYIAWDMSRASKSPEQDVIRYLEDVAKETMEATGFFHSGTSRFPDEVDNDESTPYQKYRRHVSRQHGVLRTNCIDCLDRTNAAQFLMGKCALGHQLYALGIVATPNVEFDTDVVNIFTEMYHDHGDTIALQYGGSHLVNTMETYRKINQWTSHSRDMIETIRRYYTNAFVDAEKQDAINLFLGNYIPEEGLPPLWELSSDYHLHNEDPRNRSKRRHYRRWWSEGILKASENMTSSVELSSPSELFLAENDPDESDPYLGYWVEYYEPRRLTIIGPTTRDGKQIETYNNSPFTVRHFRSTIRPRPSKPENPAEEDSENVEPNQREKSGFWSMEGLVTRSLDPNINQDEYKEYKRYTNQFINVDRLTTIAYTDDQLGISTTTAHPEYQHYTNYVNRNDLESNPRALQTQTIDKQVYLTYIDVPMRAVAVQLSRHVGSYVQGNAKQRYDGYATYHFKKDGVTTRVGYIGGNVDNPNYRQVCGGDTEHAEAVEVIFDPSKVSYATLTEFFYKLHDPTTLNAQGPDHGTQYRSAIFYHNDEQKKIAEQVTAEVQEKHFKGKKIVTQIVPAGTFWTAEEYHQKYLNNNPGGYE
ncbi:unnamed protein product, partial [Umbelopsis sp. WA50703]